MSIKDELIRSATKDMSPILQCEVTAFQVAMAFRDRTRCFINDAHVRAFFLLVAEAL